MPELQPTERTRVKRLPARGVYDRDQIYTILDEGFLCHLGFAVDDQPYVIPTAYARHEDVLYLHGSAASRIMRMGAEPVDVCVTVTLVDGFVLARSAFHHSMNYRSVMVLGKARLITDPDEKWRALHLITDHLVPGRSAEVRPMKDQEVRGTGVLVLPIEEASAKVRTGPPKDEQEDYELPIWGGVVPIITKMGTPMDDGHVPAGVPAIDPARFALRGKK